MTFSIVAIDTATGDAGFAIASCCWDAGQVCRAEAGKGAIASQANGNTAFLRAFFESLGEGATVEMALERFRSMDPDIQTRQVGMVAAPGQRLAFTGNRASWWCGHRVGDGYSCQGNTLVGPQVVDAMAEAFERAEGHLFERLHAALEAGDAAGGDARGRQSARLCVKAASGGIGEIDVRIEDHDAPVAELGRILVARAELAATFMAMGMLGPRPASKAEAAEKLRAHLEGKLDCRHLDAWATLGEMCDEAGDAEGAERALAAYLRIRPEMAPNLREDAGRGLLSKTWTRRLLGEEA